jgi:hypothetical protein
MASMPAFYLTTYTPLVATKAGREASTAFGIAPFVDGSIRREPDLEHTFPAISSLCRADKFAPRLKVGDVVAYMLRKGSYGHKPRHWRLTAVMRVLEVCPTHLLGANWYRSRNLPLPNNCWVTGNPPKPLEQSHRRHEHSDSLTPEQIHREWDVQYRARAMKWGAFVVCERLYCRLGWDAPEVTKTQLVEVFGAVPGTMNPGSWTIKHAERLLSALGLDVPLSVP